MDQINARVHELDTLITRTAGVDATIGDFARACAEAEIWGTIEEAIRNKASRARQVRNALLPIQQLPTEIFLQVLRMVVPPFLERADYYVVLKQLSRVCHRWTQIINGTPAFWSRIHGWDRSDVVTEALERSAHHALDVWFDEESDMGRMNLEDFVDNLIPHIGRCRKLAFTCSHSLQEAKKLLELPAPQMEQLILRGGHGTGEFATVEIFAGQATYLKHIEIHGVSCRWESTVFKGLKSLSISTVLLRSLNQLFEILQHSPTLLKLKLQYIPFPNSDADTSHISQQINLPLLNNLEIWSHDWRQAEALLGCIHAPGCTHLHLSMVDTPGIEGSIARLPALWPNQLRILIPNLRSIHVAVMEFKTALSTSSSDGRGGLSLVLTHLPNRERSASLLGGINDVIKNHLSASESTLQVDGGAFRYLGYQNHANEIIRLPTVTRLDLGDLSTDPEMWHPWSEEDQYQTLPPFPSLKLLRFLTLHEDWGMTVIGAVFHNPAIDAQNRPIDIEVHSRTKQANQHRTDTLAPRIRAIIGETNRLSFMVTPVVDTISD